MQVSQSCSANAQVLSHGVMSDHMDDNHDFEELDPSGRYGRYKDVLGKGAFKVVYKGFDIVDGIEVAWNQIKVKNALHTAEDIERFYSEVHLLKMLKHKNIIKFYHSWVDTEAMKINFLTEIFTSGTLRQYLKRHKRIDIRAIKKWSRQILRGLLYLHSQDPPIIHRDLKCDNIFINGNQGEVKIGDLGLAAILNQAHAAHTVLGTPEFMAPELYQEEYTELVDIYSFGMCLLEMITGEYPYSECANAAQIYKKVTSGKKPEVLNKVRNSQIFQFVEKCIAPASRRLPARELLMDPFLQHDEATDVLGEACTMFKATNSRTIMGSFSDLQTMFMNRSLASTVSFASLGSFSSLSDMCQKDVHSSSLANSHKLGTRKILQRLSPSSHCIEDKEGRKMDLQIKGKKRQNGIIHLRLRIADMEGQSRIIEFSFDVERDTAICVAQEMVTELDLIYQDAIKIAEIIDDAIAVILPEWHHASIAMDMDDVRKNQGCSDISSSISSSQVSTSVESSLMGQPEYGSLHNNTSTAPQTEVVTHACHQDAVVDYLPPLGGDDYGAVTTSSSKESLDYHLCLPTSHGSCNIRPTTDSIVSHDPVVLFSRDTIIIGIEAGKGNDHCHCDSTIRQLNGLALHSEEEQENMCCDQ